jgi:hypothetical protein
VIVWMVLKVRKLVWKTLGFVVEVVVDCLVLSLVGLFGCLL